MSYLKVFQINDCDWYAGESIESAITLAMELSGLDYSDLIDDHLHELTDEEMDKMIIGDERNESGTSVDKHTFREWLSIMKNRGEYFPCFFASTEW
jgi:hypothetical protein